MSFEYNFQTIGGKKKNSIWALAGTTISSTENGTEYEGFVEVYCGERLIGKMGEYIDGLAIEGDFNDKRDWNEDGEIPGLTDDILYLSKEDVFMLYRIMKDDECNDKTLWEKYSDNGSYTNKEVQK